MVWPVLDAVDPPTVAAGAAVVVGGHGGYVHCSGGLYDESARSFDLTLDGVAIDDLGCYVNHCQTTITIPAATAPGQHSIAAEGGSQITVQVQPRALNHAVYLPRLTR